MLARYKALMFVARLTRFREHVHHIRNSATDSSGMSLAEFRQALLSRLEADWFEPEILAALDQMQEANQVMVADDMIYFV
jgi:hypothetical protein